MKNWSVWTLCFLLGVASVISFSSLTVSATPSDTSAMQTEMTNSNDCPEHAARKHDKMAMPKPASSEHNCCNEDLATTAMHDCDGECENCSHAVSVSLGLPALVNTSLPLATSPRHLLTEFHLGIFQQLPTPPPNA